MLGPYGSTNDETVYVNSAHREREREREQVIMRRAVASKSQPEETQAPTVMNP